MKKLNAIFSFFLLISASSCSQPTIPDKEMQIASAVQAAPEDEREGAKVFGYDSKGNLAVLREGTNSLTCISDDFNKKGFQSVCYHNDLEPFMTRGRELKAEGLKFKEIFDTREKEAKDGLLEMPTNGATLHLLEGGEEAGYDAESGEVIGVNYRYVVYMPWATAESTGLPLKPMVEGGPWIMDPGTHRAHIMITPPKVN